MRIRAQVYKDTKLVECNQVAVEKLLLKAFQTVLKQSKINTRAVRENLNILKQAKLIELDVTITTDSKVRQLNKQYRKLDKTTDVLSFSSADSGLVSQKTIHLGDIIVSAPMVLLQAKRFKVTPELELKRLLVHGFLHLLGFDHVHVSAALRAEMRLLEDLSLGLKPITPAALQDLIEMRFKNLKPYHPLGTMDAYVGGRKSKLQYLGLSTPQVRTELQAILSELPQELFSTANLSYIFKHSRIFEVKSAVLSLVELHRKQLSHKKLFNVIKPWVRHVDNWALSDSLSSLYAACLEEEPKAVLPTLKAWNSHKSEWHIRQSLVSLFYYASQRKKYPPFKICIRFLKPHLQSPHFYVQKAVGWTLRELRTVYEKQTEEFLKQYIHSIKGYAFSAATERMSAKKKEAFKKLKKIS